ncbi:hypothetical protein [Actinoallomurus sp. CA-142502]|uniref:hypothetical protein n=1 Tax=Actinoallomurus sp. CA-142502 TaxID=3239885 RepID=UPI003D8DEB20
MSTPHGGSHAQKQYWSWRSMVTGTVDAITFTGALAVAATLAVAAGTRGHVSRMRPRGPARSPSPPPHGRVRQFQIDERRSSIYD